MTDDQDMVVRQDVYENDAYDHERFQRRRNSLTNDDLGNISTIIEEVLRQRAHSDAACRFVGISPEDLRLMVEAHKKFNSAMDDSKTIVRRFIILSILTGMGGIALIGWWETVVKNVKKVIAGN